MCNEKIICYTDAICDLITLMVMDKDTHNKMHPLLSKSYVQVYIMFTFWVLSLVMQME